ncbi:MAG: hypothetical protein NMK33_05960 (plasmid) [Candidatus Cardinium sp.]|uniref:VirB4 family type IV secretion system protein n=1 Tax=Cardinium endosymbiont of Dermatophagoides farinae TaxID=2597823 RepID=UPI001183A325|nr:DUF87 domain-containing protein [Cardinium endosymbiont of Dermatophagoides farinae]TSJ80158.1 hypothetical protein FPG78_06040 [Cardinium endosymbiont of Dermatophagoides farinae]UWW97592.1 MAG: hypothetical protein NMK33_05960 [Candidatus Cardinium sp.]
MLFSKKDKKEDLHRVLPFVDFHDDMAISADGTISVPFKAFLAFQEQYTEQHYIDWTHMLSSSMKELPSGSLLQQIDIYHPDQWHNPSVDSNELDFFKQKQFSYTESRPILHYESYIILSFPGFYKDYTPLSTFYSRDETKNFSKNPFTNLEKRLTIAKKDAAQFRQSVSTNLPLTPLTSDEFSRLVHRCLSLNFKDPEGTLYGGLVKNKEYVEVANRKAQVISLMESSAEPSYTVLDKFGNNGGVCAPLTEGLGRSLDFPHIISRVIRMIDSEAFLKNHFNAFAWSEATKLDERKLQNIRHIRSEMAEFEQTLLQRNEPIVYLSFLVIPFCITDLETLNNYSAQVLAAFAGIGMRGYLETIDTANLFCAALPGNGNQVYRRIPIPLLTAIAHMNSTTPFTGYKEGVLLANRYREPIYFNPFNTDLDNQNAFIFGPSGSGKSFFNGKMIKNRFEAGHIVIVIDSGGTYRHLFEALGGKYIELSAEKSLALNPFLFPSDESGRFLPDSSKIIFLVGLIGKMWKGDLNKNPMSEVKKFLLSQWISDYYRNLSEDVIPTLTGFYDYLQALVAANGKAILDLKKDQLFLFQEFFIVLHPFSHGIYKDHFNALSQDYLVDHRLVCFELEAIKGNSKLYPLVVQILFDFAFEMVAKHPDATKFIDIEEGWTNLDDASREHIEAFYRKGRKTKTSIRIITQDIGEIKSSKIASAIKNNAATFILLYNEKASSREEIGTFLGMNALDMQKYASLRRHNGPGGFREIFIKEMGQSHVWLLEPSLWEHAMFTSHPSERNQIAALAKKHGNIEDGIAEWVYHTKQKYYV